MDTLTFEPHQLCLTVRKITIDDIPPYPCFVPPPSRCAPTTVITSTTTRQSRCPSSKLVEMKRLPAWLWTLRPSEWSMILITDTDKQRLRQYHPSLYNQYSTKIRVVEPPLSLDKDVTEAVVWWISGSYEFVTSLMLPLGIPTVAWVMGSSRRSPATASTPSSQWLNISHAKVGGSTTSRGKFLVCGLSDRIEIPQDLTRNIGHIIKYSLRSQSCPPIPEFPHYCLSSKLSVPQLNKVVVVPSNFSATGWGSRTLDPAELATAFELPDYLAWKSHFATQLVPLQLLRSVMDSVLDMQKPAEQPSGGQRPCLLRPSTSSFSSEIDREWIPSLQRWLSGSWADIPIADKAVKADDAKVNASPWHMRIAILFPCRRSIFDLLTRFAMRRWRRNVIRSFFDYLRCQYGDWPRLLSRKRPRLPYRSDVVSNGVSESGGEFQEFQCLRPELLVDLTKGLAVLGQVIQSTWWEWSSGSSLLFWRWNGAEQIKSARDGMRIYVSGPLPKAKRLKALQLPGDQVALVAAKIYGTIARHYLSAGPIKSCLHFFAVPKGPTDVRIVYDGTSCGLNDALWAPNFYLPSSKAAAILLTFSSWLADADYGEMFHNFFMDEKNQKTCWS